MKKTTILFTSLILTSCVMTKNVNAAENESNLKVTSKVTTEFIPGENQETKPVNPENPNEPVNPNEEPGHSGGKGALRIDWVPDFNFGKNEILSTTDGIAIPVVRTESQKIAHFFQVSDLRGEENPKWKLSVTGNELTQSKGSIKGASISFLQTKIHVPEGQDENNTPKWMNTKSSNVGVITLDGQPSDIIQADGEGASGTWSVGLSNNDAMEKNQVDKNIQLNIPQNQISKIKKGAYSTNLDWNLSAGIETSYMTPKIVN